MERDLVDLTSEHASYVFRFRVAGGMVTCAVADSTIEAWGRAPLAKQGIGGIRQHALRFVAAHLRHNDQRGEDRHVTIRDGRVHVEPR